MKFLVDIWVDGYDNDQAIEEACKELLQSLDSAGVSIHFEKVEEGR